MYSYIIHNILSRNMSSPNMSKDSTPQDKSYVNFLKEGINGNQWGYGIRRVKLNADPNAPEFVTRVPYTYTSSGFKNQEGNWFVCLRMNVDQHSPQKMQPMNQHSHIHQLWGEMMLEFAQEYADKHKNNQISH